jgi:hypothetical protein
LDGKEGSKLFYALQYNLIAFFMLGASNGNNIPKNLQMMNLTQSSNLSDLSDPNNSNPNALRNNQVFFENVLRYFRFICQNCKKSFKSKILILILIEILTNEIGTSII